VQLSSFSCAQKLEPRLGGKSSISCRPNIVRFLYHPKMLACLQVNKTVNEILESLFLTSTKLNTTSDELFQIAKQLETTAESVNSVGLKNE